jgi:thymidylate kinase
LTVARCGVADTDIPPRDDDQAQTAPALVARLARCLEDHGVVYCQWKGQRKHARWSAGHGDIDLLVHRGSVRPFRDTLTRLGFKPVLPGPGRGMVATESFLGYDPQAERLVHVHAHYRLMVGDYWRTAYRLPLEEPILASTVPGPVFPVPAPELELLAFVLRMVGRYSVGQLVAGRQPRWLPEIQAELTDLESQADRDRLRQSLAEYLPSVEMDWFDRCLQSLRPSAGRWGRLALRRQLTARLAPHAVRPPALAVLAAANDWAAARIKRRRRRRPGLAQGGLVVALLGGDGAGKSTCARELYQWLSRSLRVRWAHLGKPPRSALTLLVGGALKACRSVGGLGGVGTQVEMLRHVCTARDRYRLYVSACRTAAAGGIAICERFPIEQNRILAGPCLDLAPYAGYGGGLAAAMRRLEARYYRRIVEPELVLVLRLDPEVAVRRKTTEPADYVRARARVIWETDWAATRARVVDAGRPLPLVVADLKHLIWETV